jgi:hypothetical protein
MNKSKGFECIEDMYATLWCSFVVNSDYEYMNIFLSDILRLNLNKIE